MSKLTLTQLFSSSPRIDTSGFWKSLESVLACEEIHDVKFNVKCKQNLVASIRYACSTIGKNSYIDTVLLFINQIAINTGLSTNFNENDTKLFQAFASLTTAIIEKNGENVQRNCNFFDALHKLFDSCQLFKINLANDVAASIISVLINKREPINLISKALSLLFLLIEIDDVKKEIQKNITSLHLAITESKFPRIQLQFLELFWRTKIKTDSMNFEGIESQGFINQAHHYLSEINPDQKEGLLVFSFQWIRLDENDLSCEGWLDIGFDDMLICFNDSVTSLLFDDVDGLNSDGSNIIITFRKPIPSLGLTVGKSIEIKFSSEMAPTDIDLIFARISKGESQPASQIVKTEVKKVESAKQSNPKRTNNPKSSIAMFIPNANTPIRNPKPHNDLTRSLNSEQNMDISSFDDDQCISEPQSDSLIPPPPEIEYNGEETKSMVFEQPLAGPFEKVDSALNMGLDTLAKTRLEAVDVLSSNIINKINVFKENLRTAVKDRETSSIKQLDSAKQKFQNNIQQFKRKESSIHQTLNNLEEETKDISSRLTQIQKELRDHLQERKAALEEELNGLRKKMRASMDLFNDDEFIYESPGKNKHPRKS